ncbi:MAG: hypothetical protein LAO79_05795 [Acidobacteriia bacterium]|nr:hypothetical protein [Terriglobia bacterium]
MSFDIAGLNLAKTPTLEAVATGDEKALAADLRKRVEEAIQAAESQKEVVEARESQAAAERKLGSFKNAERWLSDFAKAALAQAAIAAEAALNAWIASAAVGEKPEYKKAAAVASIETQHQFAIRAIERLVEHFIPAAQIESLREESHALMTRARAVEAIAQQRAQKILGQVRDAVSDEMVLPIDLSKGVSGALLAHSAGWKKMALQISANADELERSYNERRKA